jgi:perosamine synthetase
LGGNEGKYVKECLDGGWVSSVGPFVNRFEDMVAHQAQTKHAVATVNGTAALHVALLVAGVEPDEEVVVSSLSFIAPANAIRYVNAWPVFVDAEPGHWQMDADQLNHFLQSRCEWTNGILRNRITGRRVRAVLPVHILGHTCDMDPILQTAARYGLPVIEDATECLGAAYKGRPAGGIGDIGCFSFNGNKILTTGGGGMIVTNREEWAARARYLSTQAKDDPIEYVHGAIGFNYRLTSIQAAVGVAQMERLGEFLAAKRRIAEFYRERFAEVPGLTLMQEAGWCSSAWWMYTVLLEPEVFGESSRGLLRRLASVGIQSRPLWQPLNLSPAHLPNSEAFCPVSESLAARAISLPCSVGLSRNDQCRVVSEVLTSMDSTQRQA